MLGEARHALKLAESYGVEDRLACVLGIGEELPFVNASIDIVYSGGCFHHMRLDHVATELDQVLKPGGKFSGVDPWKTLLHTVGTKVVGKRETSVYCRPITPSRIAAFKSRFPDLFVAHHGPVLRYLFLGLAKAKITLPVTSMMKVMKLDDRIGKVLGLSKKGGSLVIAGTKK